MLCIYHSVKKDLNVCDNIMFLSVQGNEQQIQALSKKEKDLKTVMRQHLLCVAGAFE